MKKQEPKKKVKSVIVRESKVALLSNLEYGL
jgi:hypothetical protein